MDSVDETGSVRPILSFGHGHHFQQMTVRILEIKAASTATFVDLAIGMAEWPAAVRNAFAFHPAEDCVEFLIADMKGIVMAADAAWFPFIREIEGQAVVDSYPCKVAIGGCRQPEDFRKELRRRHLVLRRHDCVV